MLSTDPFFVMVFRFWNMRTLMAHLYIVNGNVFACTENILSVTSICLPQRHAVSLISISILIVSAEGTLRSDTRSLNELSFVFFRFVEYKELASLWFVKKKRYKHRL